MMTAPATGAHERLSPRLRRLVAPNSGPFTYTGTCSYIVGSGEVAIVDPGPDDPRHVDALLAATAGERIAVILVTHTHRDHSPGARMLRDRTGAQIAGCAPYAAPDYDGPGLDASHDRAHAPDRVLREGERLEVGDATLETLETPGHAANHLCFAIMEDKALFTGDHVMAWATTVIGPPDGSMHDYMASIERLRTRDDAIYWPGHGGPVRNPQRYLRALIHHRRQREAAILQRLEKGDETIPAMVAHIYESVDKRLHPAAACMVLAHLEDLSERGVVAAQGAPGFFARWVRV